MRPHFFSGPIKRIKKPWRTSWLSSACQHVPALSGPAMPWHIVNQSDKYHRPTSRRPCMVGKTSCRHLLPEHNGHADVEGLFSWAECQTLLDQIQEASGEAAPDANSRSPEEASSGEAAPPTEEPSCGQRESRPDANSRSPEASDDGSEAV